MFNSFNSYKYHNYIHYVIQSMNPIITIMLATILSINVTYLHFIFQCWKLVLYWDRDFDVRVAFDKDSIDELPLNDEFLIFILKQWPICSTVCSRNWESVCCGVQWRLKGSCQGQYHLDYSFYLTQIPMLSPMRSMENIYESMHVWHN